MIPPLGASMTTPPDRALRDAVRQLEGVFVEQLFKAMRETVPQDGLTSGGSGEGMFTTLMDQHLAAGVPARWPDDLTESLLARFRATDVVPTTDPK